MGLLGNGFRHNLAGRITTATTNIDGCNASVIPASRNLAAFRRNMLVGSATLDSRSSVPDGCRHPVAWLMPQVAGGLSTRNSIIGAGGLALSIQQAREAAALLVGSGGVMSPVVGLVVQVAAVLLGAGGVLPVTPQLIANLAALLTGSGDIDATNSALLDLEALLTGSGDIDPNNTALADLAVIIRGYGDLTPEGLRDAVWQANAASFNDAGTMGEKLNDAGSAANPWTEVIESGYTAAEILRLIAAVAQGSATDLEGAAPVFKSIDGTKNRVTATYAGGTRTVTGRDAT